MKSESGSSFAIASQPLQLFMGTKQTQNCVGGTKFNFKDLVMPDQKTMGTSCLGGFPVMLIPKLLLTPVRLGFLAPKRPKLVQNMHFWSF